MKTANTIIFMFLLLIFFTGCSPQELVSTGMPNDQQQTVIKSTTEKSETMDIDFETVQMVTFFNENKSLFEELALSFSTYTAPNSKMIYGHYDDVNGLIWSDGLGEISEIEDELLLEKCRELFASSDYLLDAISFGAEQDTSVPYCSFSKKLLDSNGYPEYLISVLHLKTGEARREIYGGDLVDLGNGWWFLTSIYDAPYENIEYH